MNLVILQMVKSQGGGGGECNFPYYTGEHWIDPFFQCQIMSMLPRFAFPELKQLSKEVGMRSKANAD